MEKENVSLIVIGTELTQGVIQDKHGKLVSRELSHLGYHMNQIVALPDDGTISEVLRALIKHNDVVIVTGGLGPTSDDMTRNAIAEVSGHPLSKNQAAWDTLYKRVGERIWGANEKQAYIPESFTTMPNPNGTAEGFYGYAGEVLIISLPGPPREMEPMFYSYVLPYLSALKGHHSEQREEFSTYLIAEAKLEELTLKADPTLIWGTRFQDYKISLYVSGGSAERRAAAVSALRKECGDALIASGDHTALSSLRESLLSEHKTLSCAESCTGGMASMLLTDEAGSSDYFLGSVVSYSNEAKETLLGVSKDTIGKVGAVSEETAREMAEGALANFTSDYAFSITGVAGPGESEHKKVGMVCFGFAGKDRMTQSVTLHFTSWGRASIRKKSCTAAFLMMKAFMEGSSLLDIVSKWNYI